MNKLRIRRMAIEVKLRVFGSNKGIANKMKATPIAVKTLSNGGGLVGVIQHRPSTYLVSPISRTIPRMMIDAIAAGSPDDPFFCRVTTQTKIVNPIDVVGNQKSRLRMGVDGWSQ